MGLLDGGQACSEGYQGTRRDGLGEGRHRSRRRLLRGPHGRGRLLERSHGRERLHDPQVERVHRRVMFGSEAGAAPASSATEAKATAAGAARLPRTMAAYLLVAPFALILFAFFVVPIALTFVVSFWSYNEYSITPDFTLTNYIDVFEGCATRLPELCTTFKTYLSTAKFCIAVWALTLILGFTVSYFLAFH